MYQSEPLARRCFLGLHVDRALVVQAALEGGAAGAAGVRPGDRVVSINGVELESAGGLHDAVRRLGPLPRIVFGLEREGRALALEADAPPLPAEALDGGRVELSHVCVGGHRLRTVLAVPVGGAQAAVLFVQGLHAVSCEFPLDPAAPTRRLVEGLVSAGFAVMRVERSGVGDSEGPPPSRTDLTMELATQRAALEALASSALAQPHRLFLFGHSFGGMVAPLIARDREAAGVVVYGTSALRWHDCVMGTSLRRRRLAGWEGARLDEDISRWRELHELVCRQGWTPARLFDRRPHLFALRSRDCDGDTLYGRHVSVFQQLDAMDLGAAWRALGEGGAPVLALHGEYDWVCTGEESAQIIAATGPLGQYVDLAKTGHDMLVHEHLEAAFRTPRAGRWDGRVVDVAAEWMSARLPSV